VGLRLLRSIGLFIVAVLAAVSAGAQTPASCTVPGPAPEAVFHVTVVLVEKRTLVTSVGTVSATPPQTPPVQASLAVHALASLHVVPSGAFGFEHSPVAGEQVPAV